MSSDENDNGGITDDEGVITPQPDSNNYTTNHHNEYDTDSEYIIKREKRRKKKKKKKRKKKKVFKIRDDQYDKAISDHQGTCHRFVGFISLIINIFIMTIILWPIGYKTNKYIRRLLLYIISMSIWVLICKLPDFIRICYESHPFCKTILYIILDILEHILLFPLISFRAFNWRSKRHKWNPVLKFIAKGKTKREKMKRLVVSYYYWINAYLASIWTVLKDFVELHYRLNSLRIQITDEYENNYSGNFLIDLDDISYAVLSPEISQLFKKYCIKDFPNTRIMYRDEFQRILSSLIPSTIVLFWSITSSQKLDYKNNQTINNFLGPLTPLTKDHTHGDNSQLIKLNNFWNIYIFDLLILLCFLWQLGITIFMISDTCRHYYYFSTYGNYFAWFYFNNGVMKKVLANKTRRELEHRINKIYRHYDYRIEVFNTLERSFYEFDDYSTCLYNDLNKLSLIVFSFLQEAVDIAQQPPDAALSIEFQDTHNIDEEGLNNNDETRRHTMRVIKRKQSRGDEVLLDTYKNNHTKYNENTNSDDENNIERIKKKKKNKHNRSKTTPELELNIEIANQLKKLNDELQDHKKRLSTMNHHLESIQKEKKKEKKKDENIKKYQMTINDFDIDSPSEPVPDDVINGRMLVASASASAQTNENLGIGNDIIKPNSNNNTADDLYGDIGSKHRLSTTQTRPRKYTDDMQNNFSGSLTIPNDFDINMDIDSFDPSKYRRKKSNSMSLAQKLNLRRPSTIERLKEMMKDPNSTMFPIANLLKNSISKKNDNNKNKDNSDRDSDSNSRSNKHSDSMSQKIVSNKKKSSENRNSISMHDSNSKNSKIEDINIPFDKFTNINEDDNNNDKNKKNKNNIKLSKDEVKKDNDNNDDESSEEGILSDQSDSSEEDSDGGSFDDSYRKDSLQDFEGLMDDDNEQDDKISPLNNDNHKLPKHQNKLKKRNSTSIYGKHLNALNNNQFGDVDYDEEKEMVELEFKQRNAKYKKQSKGIEIFLVNRKRGKMTVVRGLMELGMDSDVAKREFKKALKVDVLMEKSSATTDIVMLGDLRYKSVKFMKETWRVPAKLLFYKSRGKLIPAFNQQTNRVNKSPNMGGNFTIVIN